MTICKGTFDKNKQFALHVQTNLAVVWHWTIRYIHQEQRKTKSISISNPSSWQRFPINSKQCHKLEATRCCNSQRITRRRFGEVPNRQRMPERWKMYNSTLPMNLFWMETVLLLVGREYWILKVRDYKQFLPIKSRSDQWLEPKYSNPREIWWSKFKFRHNSQAIRNLECEYHKELNNTHDKLFLPRLTTKILKPRHDRSKKKSCGATASTGNRWKVARKISSCAKAKAYIIQFQSTSLDIDPSKSVNQKGLWIRRHLQAFHEDPMSYRMSRIRRSSTMGSCFDKHAKCWANSGLGQRKVDWCI